MDNERDLTERRLSRHDLLKLAAAAGGATLLAGPPACSRAARALADGGERSATGARLGRLRQRRRPGDVRGVREEVPEQQAEVHVMTNEADALAKFHAGLKPDIFRPYVGWTKYFATSGFVQPWNPKLIPNLKHLNPFMVKAGQYKGKQYGIPDDWGFDAILYRTRQGEAEGAVLGPPLRRALQGQDRLVRRHRDARDGRPLPRLQEPWDQTDAQLKQSQKLLISKKHLVRMFWSSETDLWEAFGAGDVWIAYAWPNDWVQMKKKGLPVVYMHPKEKPIAWVGHVHAPQGHLAPAARARLRRRLELGEVGEVARGQLRLRAREPQGPAVVERPAEALQLDEPEGRHASPTRTSTATSRGGRSTRSCGKR